MKSVYICWNLEIAAISLRKSCFPHRILEKSQNRNTIRQPNQRHVYRIDRTIDDSGCLLFDLISKLSFHYIQVTKMFNVRSSFTN